MNKLFDKDLVFDASIHKYSLKSDDTIKFTSTTTLIHNFFRKFDAEKVASNLINNVPKYAGRKAEDLKQEWKKSAEDGTTIHNEIESYIIDETIVLQHPKSLMAKNFLETLNPNWVVYPEAPLFSKELQVSGTADLLIYDKDKNRYAIGDWKTNKRIYTKSFNNQLGTAKATSHLMDCNFIHYSLQLSMYKYILTKYYGLNIDKLFIIHLAELAYNKYDCDYLENEITDMLDEWKLSNGNIKLITKEE